MGKDKLNSTKAPGRRGNPGRGTVPKQNARRSNAIDREQSGNRTLSIAGVAYDTTANELSANSTVPKGKKRKHSKAGLSDSEDQGHTNTTDPGYAPEDTGIYGTEEQAVQEQAVQEQAVQEQAAAIPSKSSTTQQKTRKTRRPAPKHPQPSLEERVKELESLTRTGTTGETTAEWISRLETRSKDELDSLSRKAEEAVQASQKAVQQVARLSIELQTSQQQVKRLSSILSANGLLPDDHNGEAATAAELKE